MLLERCLSINRKRSHQQFIKYLNFRCKIHLDHPVQSVGDSVRGSSDSMGNATNGDESSGSSGSATVAVASAEDAAAANISSGKCKKIGLLGKLILEEYFQENMTSQRPFLLLRIGVP